MKSILLFTLVMLSCLPINAQSDAIISTTGIVLDVDEQPIEFVNISIRSLKENRFLGGTYTDETGKYTVEYDYLGDVIIEHSHLNFITQLDTFNLSSSPQENRLVVLELHTNSLTTAEVTSTRSLITRKVDRLVLNVREDVADSYNETTDLLRTVPGVWVDISGDLKLNGKSNVLLMVNEQPIYLSSQEAVEYINAIDPSAISSIEVITNPSARYDAEGVGGIINLVLNGVAKEGTSGKISTGLSLSPFYNDYNYPLSRFRVNLTNQKGKVTTYGRYRFKSDNSFQAYNSQRQFENAIIKQDILLQYQPDKQHTAEFGTNIALTENSAIRLTWNGKWNDVLLEQENNSSNNIDDFDNLLSSTSSELEYLYKHNTLNTNYYKILDSLNSKLQVQASYAHFSTKDRGHFNIKKENITRDLNNDSDSNISIFSGEVSFLKNISSEKNVEIGLKSSSIQSNNRVDFFDQKEDKVKIDHLSSLFNYKEFIQAAYITHSRNIRKYAIKFGGRLEHTYTLGSSLNKEEDFKRSYLYFFPSLHLQRTINESDELNISYSRRIQRPDYEDINPYLYYVNDYSLLQGNPSIQPSLVNSFELSYLWMGWISASVSYNIASNPIISVDIPSTNDNEIFITRPDNAKKHSYFGTNLTIPIPIGEWFQSVNNFQYYSNRYEIGSSSIYNGLIQRKGTFQFYSQNEIRISKGLNIELGAYYISGSTSGIYQIQATSLFVVGMRKKLFNDRGLISLHYHDVFGTLQQSGSVSVNGLESNFNSYENSKQIRLSFSYKFNKNKEIEKDEWEFSNQDELDRISK